RRAGFIDAGRRAVTGVVKRGADIAALAQAGLECVELALRQVLRRAQAIAGAEATLQRGRAEADGGGQFTQRRFAAIEQLARAFRGGGAGGGSGSGRVLVVHGGKS